MRITEVMATMVRADDTNRKSWLSESLVANPMSVYPEYKDRRSSWQPKWGSDLFVQAATDEGIVGTGCSIPAGAKQIIEDHFRLLLVGQDPFDIEKLWDQMFRASWTQGATDHGA